MSVVYRDAEGNIIDRFKRPVKATPFDEILDWPDPEVDPLPKRGITPPASSVGVQVGERVVEMPVKESQKRRRVKKRRKK